MKLQNPETKEKFINRLRRIEGQVRGVESMVREERDCRDILQQLVAIRSAVQASSLAFMDEYASECLLKGEDANPIQQQRLIKDFVAMLGKVP